MSKEDLSFNLTQYISSPIRFDHYVDDCNSSDSEMDFDDSREREIVEDIESDEEWYEQVKPKESFKVIQAM